MRKYRSTRRLSFVFALLASLVLLSGEVGAQVGTASLSGTVTDPSGAAIPGAQVMLQSATRAASRQTVTNSTGGYVIGSILPGTYRVVVTAKGFETHVTDNVILSSGQGSTLNVALLVGRAMMTVTVTETSPLLQTTTATLGSQVTAREMTNLPVAGQNFTSLIGILPGVSTTADPKSSGSALAPPGGGAINPSVYGQRQRDNEYTLDGSPNAELIFNDIPMFPPPEAIAEMKVESGMDSGAFGWASGANINLVTKSGTNNYHGDAWEYLRNNALDARSFFSPKVGTYKWNLFGFSGGGPLAIPHVLSKKKGWYIYGWYEGIRDPSGPSPFYDLVPSNAELNGNFQGDPPIYNPYTTVAGVRQPFTNNIIPPGATTVCAPKSTCIDPAALLIAKTLYPRATLPQNSGPGGTNYLGESFSTNTYDQWSTRVDHQFGQRDTFFARYSDARNPRTSISFPELPGLTGGRYTNVVGSWTHVFNPSFLVTARYGMQRVFYNNVTGGPDVATPAGTLAGFPPYYGQNVIPPLEIPGFPGLSQGIAFYGPQYIHTWTGDFQKISGRHSLSFGGGVTRLTFITDNQTAVYAQFDPSQTSNFTPDTGYALASYLLGLPSGAGRDIGNTSGNMLGYVYSLYVQDTYRATRKLTLSLGLRWDYAPPIQNQVGSATFVWETGQYVWDVTNPITGAPANAIRGLIPPDKNNFQPRVGIAYQLNPKTVLRAAYGIFFDTTGENLQSQQGNRGNWPFSFPQTLVGLNATVPDAYLENPFPGEPQAATTPLGTLQGLEVASDATRVPYTQEWNFSIQRQITPSLMVQGAYFGSHSIDMTGQIIDNTAVTPGVTPIADRQRWPQFPPYVNNGYNRFPAYYNGMSWELRQQTTHNLSLLVNYTWSKAEDYVDSLESFAYPYLNPTRFNINAFRGVASYDVTNRFVASYVYRVPVKAQNRFLNGVVGNWSTSGIFSADSGLPYYIMLGFDNENIGQISGRLSEFPNLVSNPQLSNPTINEWFNTSAYQVPAFGTAGTAGKHALYSQGEKNWDMSLYKQWPFGEDRHLEFRADFFNTVNAHTFSYPGYVLGNSNFGKVGGVRQGGRVIEFALKIHF